MTDFELLSVLQSLQLRGPRRHCPADLTPDVYESKTFLMSAPWEEICCVCSYWFIDSVSWATVASERDRLVTKGSMCVLMLVRVQIASAPGQLWPHHIVMSDKPPERLHFALHCLPVLQVPASQQKQIQAAASAQMCSRKAVRLFSPSLRGEHTRVSNSALTNRTTLFCAVSFMSLMWV